MKSPGRNVSLIARFMIAPLLGTVIILILAVFVWDYRQVQIDQFEEMRAENLRLIARIGQLKADFSENHSSVFQLLIDTKLHSDEGEFYRVARPTLNALHELEARIASILEQHAASGEIATGLNNIADILAQYRLSASNALLMATVDFSLADKFIVDAAKEYHAAVSGFTAVERSLQAAPKNDIDHYIDNLSVKITNLGLIFVGMIVIMLSLSAWLSRILSSDLRDAINNLSIITKKARNPETDGRSKSEIAMLSEAIDGARQTHQTLIETERALRENEQQLRAIFDNNVEALIVLVEDGTIIELNRTAEKLFGYEHNELVGQNISVLIDEPDLISRDDNHHGYLNSSQAKIIGTSQEVTAIRKGGKTFPVLLGIGEFEHNGQRAFVGSISDLSEKKSLEVQLRRSQKMEAIGELTGGIAHDFNNLLGIITGNIDLAQGAARDDETIMDRLNKAQNAAARGAKLTHRLLSFSEQSVEARSPININGVIEGLQDLMGKSLTSRITLEKHLSKDLWLTEVDPRALEDVLINLAINARDSMPEGGKLIIETSNRILDQETIQHQKTDPSESDFVEIAVTDTGSGIPADIREKIFDPFFTTKSKGKGTGLGLSMAYGFAKRSNGHIAVYSEEGVGSTFKLCLPRSKRQVPEQKTSKNVEHALPNGSETVLIVDDEESFLDISSSILTDLGYKTLCASNGDEALAILKENPEIDLLFTDVVMPGTLNGLALARTAQQLRPELRVLLTSGFTGKIIEKNESDDLVRSMLRKPYHASDLAIRVRETLDRED